MAPLLYFVYLHSFDDDPYFTVVSLSADQSVSMNDVEEQEEEEQEEEEEAEDNRLFEDLHPRLLLLETTILDDLHAGAASKLRIRRRSGEENKRFLPSQEVSIYLVYAAIPHLRRLLTLAGSRQIFLWLAVEAKYHRLLDSSDTCTRWSSWRNRSLLTPELLNEEDRESFIITLARGFVEHFLHDVEEMESFVGSSWIFSLIW